MVRDAAMRMDDIIDSILNDETTFAKIYDLRVTPFMCSELVIQYCENNACGKYNANWTCPPGVGRYEDCKEKVESYSKALIFRSDYKINEWYDYERVQETIAAHQANVRRIRELVPKDIDHLVLSGGGCVYCKECAYISREPCRHPDIAIPSIESYGLDIFRFTKKNKIVYAAPEGEMYYFGLILFN
jgi:predicted metal-binding protein